MADQPATDPTDAPDDANADPQASIRGQVRDMTARVLRGEMLDPRAVEDVFRTVTTGTPAGFDEQMARAREHLAESIGDLDERLVQSAADAHLALQALAAKGTDVGDNDLKEAYAKLAELQSTYVSVTEAIAAATTGTLQHELRSLADQVQHVTVDAGAQAATVMTEFARRLSGAAASSNTGSLGAMREQGVRMSSLASGVLAGVADALATVAQKSGGTSQR